MSEKTEAAARVAERLAAEALARRRHGMHPGIARGLGLGLDRLGVELREDSDPSPSGRERRSFLGGSDAAGVLGLSPWETPLDVYFEKTGTRPPSGVSFDPKRERIFRRGKRAEPHAIDMLIEDHGVKVTKRSTPDAKNYHVDAEHEFIACEIDFEWEVTPEIADRFELPEDLVGTIQNGEVKSVHPFASAKFGEEGTEEVPIEYAAQAMHGLMVTGRRLTLFVVLTGWDDLSLYWLWRDDETIAELRAKEVAFWRDHVLARVPPAPIRLGDVQRLFGRLGETRKEATDEEAALVDELKTLRRQQKVLADGIEEIQFRLGCALLGPELAGAPERVEKPDEVGRHLLTKDGVVILRVDFQQQYDLNETMLKAKYPAVAEDCAKMQQFFVYRTPNPPKAEKAGKPKKEQTE